MRGCRRQSPHARSPEELKAELAKLRWAEDPVHVLGKENAGEVYVARLVATTIWRNRSLGTEDKRYVIQGVIDNLKAAIDARNAPPAPAAAPASAKPDARAAAMAAPAKAKPAAAAAKKPAAAAKPAAAGGSAVAPAAAQKK
jgi:hypothetical protein